MKKILTAAAASLALMAPGAAIAADWVEPSLTVIDEESGMLQWPEGYTVDVDLNGYAWLSENGFWMGDMLAEDSQLYPMGNVMYLIFPESLTEGYSYNFCMPADQYTLTCDGESVATQDLSIDFTYGTSTGGDDGLEITSSYADCVASFTFPMGYAIEVARSGAEVALYRDGELVASYGKSALSATGDASYTYTLTATISADDCAADGNYKVVVPASAYTITNLFTMSGETSVELTAEFKVGDVADPVAYTSQYTDDCVIFTFDGYRVVTADDMEAILTKDGQEVATFTQDDEVIYENNYSLNGMLLVLIDPELVAEQGTYMLYISKDGYTLVDSEGEAGVTSDLVCEFVVTAVEQPTEYIYSIYPTPGVVESLSEIIISGNRQLKAATTFGSSVLFGAATFADIWVNQTISEDKLSDTLTFKDLNTKEEGYVITTPGFYQVYTWVEDNFITFADGSGFPVLNFIYEIKGDYDYTLSPVAGTDLGEAESYQFTLSFPTFSTIAVADASVQAVLVSESGAQYALTATPNAYSAKVVFTTSEAITESGTFQLVVPEGMFTLTFDAYGDIEDPTTVNQAISAAYTITTSGISAIGSDKGAYDVYSITGVKMLEGGSQADLKALPRGLYIVNGQKTFIK
ncbi:MAG: hypothetical protein LUD17_02615 [Bacteroidales bacterium]|nr:hypothetical protein [Bacteroidales bacterium]